MATTLHTRAGALMTDILWSLDSSIGTAFFDASRTLTVGADTVGSTDTVASGPLLETAGTAGSGGTMGRSTINGPTAGKVVCIAAGTTNPLIYWSPPLAADVTVSGTITFNVYAAESSMSANVTVGCYVYRVNEQGVCTAIVSASSFGTELGTSLALKTWNATPTSTNFKKGDRILWVFYFDDSSGATMATGFSATVGIAGDAATSTDSNIVFTETITFITTAPSGSTYWLRDSASALGSKALVASVGSGTITATHTTLTGPLTYPGDQWTATAGGSDIEWHTPALDAFTLGGVAHIRLGYNTRFYTHGTTPFSAYVCEIAIVDADGSNPVIWARSYPQSFLTAPAITSCYISGPDVSVGQGKRLRFRLFSDESLYGGNQVSGTNQELRYDGTSTYESKITFTQNITEEALNFQLGGGKVLL